MPTKRTALAQPWNKKKGKQTGRTHDNSKFYQSRKWRSFRLRYLAKNPLCVECKKDSKIHEANVLDHILPIRLGGDMWSYENLQGLCNSHHNKKSGREAHL